MQLGAQYVHLQATAAKNNVFVALHKQLGVHASCQDDTVTYSRISTGKCDERHRSYTYFTDLQLALV